MYTARKDLFGIITDVHYRSELWDHLFFDNCLNYPNLNYASEIFFSPN